MQKLKAGSKLLLAAAAFAAMGVLTAGGTTAYLTDNESVTNIFTVGEVTASLDEPAYPGNGSGEVADLVPNQEVPKDPRVTNTGENDMIVFMKVEVPTGYVTLIEDDGTKGESGVTDIFWLKKNDDPVSSHCNHFDENWVPLAAKTFLSGTPEEPSRYVFGYKSAVFKGGVTTPLFDKVQLKNIMENEVTPGKTLEIKVEAYAIQAANILEAGIDLSQDFSEINLEKIYDIYLNQTES